MARKSKRSVRKTEVRDERKENEKNAVSRHSENASPKQNESVDKETDSSGRKSYSDYRKDHGVVGSLAQTIVDAAKDGKNDPAWYAADPQLFMDAASFPFAYPLGDKVNLSGKQRDVPFVPGKSTSKTQWLNTFSGSPLPGVCSLWIVPTIGYSFDRNDPANVCAQALYTHVRYVNAGRKNYDPADLMIYCLAMSDVVSFIMWAKRLYAYSFMYSQRNKYIGEALIKANGFDPESLKLNLANYRMWLNAFIAKVSSMVVPGNIALFSRRAFMYANYYIENMDGNIKDQLYQFCPDSFLRFQLDNDGAGMLRRYAVRSSGSTLETWGRVKDIGNALLANISGDEDWGLMAGDILKAYGDNIIKFETIPEAVEIYPVYDEYVLSQFRNADIVYNLDEQSASTDAYIIDAVKGVNAGDVWQDGAGNIRCENTVTKWNDALCAISDKVLTTRNPNPTPADSMEATRLKIGFQGQIETMTGMPVTSINCGTEICVRCLISRMDYNNPAMVKDINHNFMTPDMSNVTSITDHVVELECLTMFHWSPVSYRVNYSVTGTGDNRIATINDIKVISNIDNYTVIGESELSKMNQAALLSLFFVPGVARIIGMSH